MTVVQRDIIVCNACGVHGRIATGLALIAREHGVTLRLVAGTEEIDGASILDVLGLALVRGTLLTVRVAGEGGRAEAALAAVELLLAAQDENSDRTPW